jgi:hypothetical protein
MPMMRRSPLSQHFLWIYVAGVGKRKPLSMNTSLWSKMLGLWLKPQLADDDVLRLRAWEEQVRLLEIRKATAAA